MMVALERRYTTPMSKEELLPLDGVAAKITIHHGTQSWIHPLHRRDDAPQHRIRYVTTNTLPHELGTVPFHRRTRTPWTYRVQTLPAWFRLLPLPLPLASRPLP